MAVERLKRTLCTMEAPEAVCRNNRLGRTRPRLATHFGFYRIGDEAFGMGLSVEAFEFVRRRLFFTRKFDLGMQGDDRYHQMTFLVLRHDTFGPIVVAIDDKPLPGGKR